MKLDFTVICDYTAVDAAGKMIIVGTFDRINAVALSANMSETLKYR